MNKLLKLSFLILAIATFAPFAGATTMFVTLNTSPLVGHAAGPFSIFFAFTDGSGTGDANNTATISNFGFNGGSASGSPTLFGGASGSLGGGISITDSSPLSFISAGFTPGSLLTFTLNLTDNSDGSTPDQLAFYILDSTGTPIPTLGPGNAFLTADLSSSGAIFSVFGSNSDIAPAGGGSGISIGAPGLSAPSSVPEPGSGYLLGSVLVIGGLVKRRFWRP